MKKIIKTTLIIFIFVLLLKSINVNAATSLPQSYSENGYDYTIDKFRIECYNGTGIMQEQNKIKEAEIDMSSTDLTITPELKEIKSKTQSRNILPIVSINLNLKMSQLFTTYAQNFMNDRTEIEKYLCVLKTDYKIKKKEGYNYFYKFDHLIYQREDVGKDIGNIQEQEGYYPSSQVIDFMIFKNKTAYASSGSILGPEIALANYSIASKVDIKTATAENDEDISLIYVHNLNNFEQSLNEKGYNLVLNENNNQNNTTDNLEGTPVNKVTKQIQTVKVPNTAASSSIYLMFISSIMLLLGGSILLYTLIKPKVLVRINKK